MGWSECQSWRLVARVVLKKRRNSNTVNELLGVTDARTLQNAPGKFEVAVVVVVRAFTWIGTEVAHSMALSTRQLLLFLRSKLANCRFKSRVGDDDGIWALN